MHKLPTHGRPKEIILETMQSARDEDVNWREGKAFSLVYDAGVEVNNLLQEAYALFFAENGLNPTAFPSLRRFESEVIAMTAGLLGGADEVVGNMTSGGTESILMAVKTARDWGRANHPGKHPPEMVLPQTAHPAFEKAAQYFGVKPVHIPVRDDFRADPSAAREAINGNTILLVASAPSYPHGVVDPIVELAAIAGENGILLHVDACVGGFMLPFVRRLGYPVPEFDFRVPGVTSISADLHKYGYAAKGASVVLYSSREIRRNQIFVYTEWPGGIYASPTMTGTRPGGAIAAAWAVMNFLGEAGYLALADDVMRTATRLKEGIDAIEGVMVLSDPEMSVLAIGSDSLNIYTVADELTLRGWHLDRQHYPPSLHLTVNHAHTQTAETFLEDLAAAVKATRKPSYHNLKDAVFLAIARKAARILPRGLLSRLMARASSLAGVRGSTLPQRSAAMYGMMGSLPNRGDLHELVLDLVESFTVIQD